jgi:capsular polysaccharide biosynthesis protein
VVNEDELWGFLEFRGFSRVFMEDLSFAEQVRCAASARFLVVVHGAGAVHCLFMPESSTIWELFSPVYIRPHMLPVIMTLGHRYFVVPSFIISRDYEYPGAAMNADIRVNVELLAVSMGKELAQN